MPTLAWACPAYAALRTGMAPKQTPGNRESLFRRQFARKPSPDPCGPANESGDKSPHSKTSLGLESKQLFQRGGKRAVGPLAEQHKPNQRRLAPFVEKIDGRA